jgi:general secretion pathway protein D
VASSEDLTFQFVNDNFRFRMQLLESKNRVTTLASPLLLTANNEVSRIFIGQTEPFTIGFESPQIVATGVTQTNLAGTPITELRDVGQLLMITPSINADRTVTLRIAQQQSRKNRGGATIPVLDAEGRVQQVAVDTVQRQTASGTIVGKDGLAVALGGLIEEEVSDVRAEVPVIGKLPVVGFFFRRQVTLRERRETVIMVRPYVFNTPPESAALSEMLIRDMSLHPNAYNGQPTLGSHAPWEVVRPDPPCNPHQNTFRFHSVRPRRY